MIETTEVTSPVGRLRLAARDSRVCVLTFAEDWPRLRARVERRWPDESLRRAPDPAGAADALRRYFDGDLDALAAVEVDLGGTPFQQRVWKAMRAIPAGGTLSYAALADAAGATGAMRAAGTASGANPVCVVVPCHRVVRSDGGLGGYGGGIDRKRWLLDHEQRHAAASAPARDKGASSSRRP